MAVLELARMNSRDRRDTIALMLETYEQARQEGARGDGGAGRPESRYLTFDPATWTPAYQELERCLHELRRLAEHGRPILKDGVSAARAWWHLRHRYLAAETVRRTIHVERNRKGNPTPRVPRNMQIVARPTILHGRTADMLVRVWHPDVQQRYVDVALDWLEREYQGEPAVYRERDDAA